MRLGRYLCFVLLIMGLCLLSGPCAGQDALRLPTYDAGVFDPNEGPIIVRYRLLKDVDEVEILVEDFRGQVIDRLNFVDLRAGDHRFSWKGLDENGQKLPDGRYRFNMRVRFTDGSAEEKTVAVRIMTMPERLKIAPPKPLLPKKRVYRVDGSLSTFYRRNAEDPGHRETDGEQRVRTHLVVAGKSMKMDGLFSMRRPYSREADYDGSRAMAEKRWEGGRLRGVFRRGLGVLGDPMKLFSDFRTERKKSGGRLDQEYGWLELTALGFGAEGNVDTEERGMACRLSFGPPEGWRLGVNYTNRRAIPDGGFSHRTSKAVSGDVRVPVRDDMRLMMEYAATEDTEGRADRGFLVKAEHEKGGLRISGGYVDLGECFAAEFSDPLRGITEDVYGGVVNADFVARHGLWKLDNMAAGLRMYVLRTHSQGKGINEGDGTLRFSLGERDSFLLTWFGREEGQEWSNSLGGNVRYRWNETYQSGLQANLTQSNASHTWRWALDGSLRKGRSTLRLSLERIRRVIEQSSASPYEETCLRFDVYRIPWRGQLSVRRSRRADGSGTNLFLRAEYSPLFLHRYRLTAYLALGNRSALETENQIEAGMEFRF